MGELASARPEFLRPLFAPIMKIDEEQRMVWGYASTEARDHQGETILRSAIEAALPEYMLWRNIREMHQPSAVGTAEEATPDAKGLWLGAKVVDDRAWLKCKSKVYKGFSIGGRVTARDNIDRSIVTGLELTEISLVDRPANPDAMFTAVKRDDGTDTCALFKRADGELMPQPVQKWECGIADHQHYSKADASSCMANTLNKGITVLPPVYVRADGTLDFPEATRQALDKFHNLKDFRGRPFVPEATKQAFDKWLKEVMAVKRNEDGSVTPIDKGMTATNSFVVECSSEEFAGRMHDFLAEIGNIAGGGHSFILTDEEGTKLSIDGDGSDHFQVGNMKAVVEKRQPNLASGKFGTHEAAAKEADDKATDHGARAFDARADERKHRMKAQRARDKGDARGVVIHERLAGAAASLAEQHDQSAEQHRQLADRHRASISKSLATENEMTTAVADAQKAATDAVAALNEIAKGEQDHAVEAGEALKSAGTHETAALAYEKTAQEDREKVTKASSKDRVTLADSAVLNETMAAHQHTLADGYYDLYMHHADLTKLKKSEIKSAIEAHLTVATRHGSLAESHKLAATAAKVAKNEAVEKHHTEIAKSYIESKEKREAFVETLRKEKPVDDDGDKTNGGDTDGDKDDHVDKSKFGKDGVAKGDKCPDCGTLNKEGAEKCEKCSKAFSKVEKSATVKCTKCGAAMPAGNEKCQSCGATLSKKDDSKAAKVAAVGSAAKGMSVVSALASIREQISSLQPDMEKLASASDEQMAEVCAGLLKAAGMLPAIIAAETQTLMAGEDAETITASVSIGSLASVLKDASAKDEKSPLFKLASTLNTILTKRADEAKKVAEAAEAAKAGNEAMQKAQSERDAAHTALGTVTAALKGLAGDMQRIQKRLKDQDGTIIMLKGQVTRLEAMPMPSRAKGILVTTSLNKSADGGNDNDGTTGDSFYDRAMAIKDPRERNAFMLSNGYVGQAR